MMRNMVDNTTDSLQHAWCNMAQQHCNQQHFYATLFLSFKSPKYLSRFYNFIARAAAKKPAARRPAAKKAAKPAKKAARPAKKAAKPAKKAARPAKKAVRATKKGRK